MRAGNLSSLNALAREHNAQAIIHTGDFGFYEHASFDRISDRWVNGARCCQMRQADVLTPPPRPAFAFF